MAPLRTAQARTRPRRSVAKVQVNGFHDSDFDTMPSTPQDDEPPLKRMRTSRSSTTTRSKWIPGGRGGGGRHVDVDDMSAVTPPPKVTPAPRPRGRPRKDASRGLPPSTPRTSARSANRATAQRPRYSTAAAATAAAAHGDGYKPREERGWEEFHPDLDLDSEFAVIPSGEIDGTVKKTDEEGEGDGSETPGDTQALLDAAANARKRGRPPGRRTDSMLQSLLTPETPKIVPPPGPNPRERLTLPKPSFRELDPFTAYEEANGVNYVDKTMANVGYQESEVFLRPDRAMIRQTEGSAEEDLELSPDLLVNVENSAIGSGGVGRVEYDMDEQDVKWLDAFNKARVADGAGPIKPAIFEVTMTKIEKEWHALEKRIPKPNPKAPQTQRPRSSSAAAVNGEPAGEEGDTKCAICDDGDCENANAIVFCDGCDLAVHQECYGVPYIPEGQWLCRKCQLVGNSRPSCIFCPHEGGAFKQTNNAKWAHLFCAIWIPEVQIGNPSLMEPITDVEKVPPSRWKLLCYICNQAMGASIQCSDGRCYRAFHLTCARQGGLYLRMKTGGGQNTLMDQSALRAYCHQHAPNDWKADHNTDRAHEVTVKYCRDHFKGQVWADSRASALAINDTSSHLNEKGPLKMTLTNKKGQKQKTIWRLPSGAPVIPEAILKSIEDSLVRFSVQKKKEYVSELCKYWTLKREARRGAALLKRLQLQMDTFSSFEVTRRDYKAQGAAGRARLDRRIEFAEMLEKDLERIRSICESVKQREAEKLAEALLLKDVVNIVYFPIPPLLDPIVEKAMKHDKERMFRQGLLALKDRAGEGAFTSVADFSRSFAVVFAEKLGSDASNFAEIIQQVSGRAEDMAPEQKEIRSRARHILRACQPFLEDAIRKESELTGRPFAQQMKELDQALNSRRNSAVDYILEDAIVESIENKPNGVASHESHDVEMHDLEDQPDTNLTNGEGVSDNKGDATVTEGPVDAESGTAAAQVKVSAGPPASTPPASTNGIKPDNPEPVLPAPVGDEVATNGQPEPPTPPMSLENQGQGQQGAHPAIGHGGTPWYVEQFDPCGTTIFEERWTGQQVLREMSEELSEMDEDELQGLGDEEGMGAVGGPVESIGAGGEADVSAADARTTRNGKKAKARKSGGGQWGDRSFRQKRWR